ncbi:MAG TPA: hypothetical protein VMI53_13455, partial [Opitutaceae bacterium]|nr:hypothetical protein [Opitutaceae bacterium]
MTVASLVGTFYDRQKKEPSILPRLIIGETSYQLIIHNNGEEEVMDFFLRVYLRDGQNSPLHDSENGYPVLRISSL